MFAGRPAVSRKGLRRFLDALLLIADITDLPSFVGWIVGGGDSEASFIHDWLRQTPGYATLLQTSRLFVWQHVDPTSLAELYSRSLVTVVPSSFEQFGLVAVEAMACGCPVVAARVGGLTDTVIPCWTGQLCDPDDVELLAAAVAGYLRNPAFAEYDGIMARKWVTEAFGLEPAMKSLESVLAGKVPPLPDQPSKRFKALQAQTICTAAERVIAQPQHLIEEVSGKSQVSIRVLDKTRGREYFIKSFRGRPSSASTYIRMPPSLLDENRVTSMLARCRALEGCDLFPPVLEASAEEGICIFPWIERAQTSDVPGLLEEVRARLSREGRRFLTPDAVNRWDESFRRAMDCRSHAELDEFDLASAELQRPLTGGQAVFTDAHPQTEMLRYRLLADNPTLPLPSTTLRRLRDSLDLLLGWWPAMPASPELSHGSLTPDNTLRGKPDIVVTDLERLGFRAGPYDHAHWIWKTEIVGKSRSFTALVPIAQAFFPEQTEQLLFVGWVIVQQLTDGFAKLVQGRADSWRRTERMMDELHEILFGLSPRPIPSPSRGFPLPGWI